MQKILALVAALALGAAACTTPVVGTLDQCAVVTPDGGAASTVACDITWSCNDGSQTFELACSSAGPNFACTCYADGLESKTFTVNVFNCDSSGAIPAATEGCAWTIGTQ